MKRALLTSAIAATCLLTAGCEGGDTEPTTDRDSARQGWLATGHALEDAGLEGVLTFNATVTEDGGAAMAMGTVECPDGGTLTVEAAAEASISDANAEADLEIRFAGCSSDGVTIDGELSYYAFASETRVELEMSGDLRFSGAAEGECALDLSLQASSNGTGSASGNIGGSMCGWGWDELG